MSHAYEPPAYGWRVCYRSTDKAKGFVPIRRFGRPVRSYLVLPNFALSSLIHLLSQMADLPEPRVLTLGIRASQTGVSKGYSHYSQPPTHGRGLWSRSTRL